MTAARRVFTADGRPFFPLGGQARNSSGYNDDESAAAFRAVHLLGGNTLEIPVYGSRSSPTREGSTLPVWIRCSPAPGGPVSS